MQQEPMKMRQTNSSTKSRVMEQNLSKLSSVSEKYESEKTSKAGNEEEKIGMCLSNPSSGSNIQECLENESRLLAAIGLENTSSEDSNIVVIEIDKI